jgi:serine/threonine protein kinase
MYQPLTPPISKKGFQKIIRSPVMCPVEDDERMYNLASGYWVYDELLSDLRDCGWVRFGPGFKGSVYGHPASPVCIKILGMGVGENPLYFCERGYYLEHERNMLTDFWDAGFRFQPYVLSQEESIELLADACGVRRHQAEMRVQNNDLLITEYIPGIPLAIQTGRQLNYDINVDAFDADVLQEMCSALGKLRVQLLRANNKGLLHNDPMPPNLIFTLDEGDNIVVKLVDFELAQNLRKPNPDYVNNTVAELYRERAVPVNSQTSAHRTNLDMHLLDESVELVKKISLAVTGGKADESLLEAISLKLPFVGGVSINLGKALKYLRRKC